MANETQHAHCHSCEALVVNGTFCHEQGCPDAWKGRKVACFVCGYDFIPEEKGQRVCPDCQHDFDLE